MSCCNEITVTVENKPQDNINVYIDETGIGLIPLFNFIALLSSNFNTYQQVMTTVVSNSADWQETYDEVNVIQNTLSAGWQENYHDVNLIQNTLSAKWQETFEYINSGIVDGGIF